MHKIAILAKSDHYLDAANQLAAKISLPVIIKRNPKEITEFDSVLIMDENGLSLQESGANAPGAVYVDFVGGAVGHRIKYGGGKGQMIAKAVGVKNMKNMHVLDATAGLGRDGFILASMGCKVTMIERSTIIFQLLQDGINRALNSGDTSKIATRISLVDANSIEYISEMNDSPDVIYLDPMFPARGKSALVKKEMRIFKKILGEDPDAASLLDAALSIAKYRVVVKRPRKSPAINDLKPSFAIEGKANRFDVYTKKSIEKR